MKNQNIAYHNATFNRDRRNQLNARRPVFIWFTGLLGSGKSTLGCSLEEELYKLGFIHIY